MNNYTTEKINIQDYDLSISDVTHERDKYNNKIIVLNCVLKESKNNVCPNCESIDNKVKDYYIREIKYIETFGYPSIIRFKQKRVICTDCKKTFNITSSIVSS